MAILGKSPFFDPFLDPPKRPKTACFLINDFIIVNKIFFNVLLLTTLIASTESDTAQSFSLTAKTVKNWTPKRALFFQVLKRVSIHTDRKQVYRSVHLEPIAPSSHPIVTKNKFLELLAALKKLNAVRGRDEDYVHMLRSQSLGYYPFAQERCSRDLITKLVIKVILSVINPTPRVRSS